VCAARITGRPRRRFEDVLTSEEARAQRDSGRSPRMYLAFGIRLCNTGPAVGQQTLLRSRKTALSVTAALGAHHVFHRSGSYPHR